MRWDESKLAHNITHIKLLRIRIEECTGMDEVDWETILMFEMGKRRIREFTCDACTCHFIQIRVYYFFYFYCQSLLRLFKRV